MSYLIKVFKTETVNCNCDNERQKLKLYPFCIPDSMRTMTSFKDFKTAIKKKKMNF